VQMGQSQSSQPVETPQKTRTTSIQVEGQEIQISNYMYYESEERHCFDMLCSTGKNAAKQHVIFYFRIQLLDSFF